MCKFKSGIILKREVFVPNYEHHTRMLEELKIKDTRANAESKFIRFELIPENNDVFSDINTWRFVVDQDIVPEWYVEELDKKRAIEAVMAWAKKHILINIDNLKLTNNTYYLKNCKNTTCYNSTVYAYDNSTVEAYYDSKVEAFGNSTIKAHYDSKVEAYNDSTVYAYDNSIVKSYNNSTIKAYNDSIVYAHYDSIVYAYDNSKVYAYDNSKVEAYYDSTVYASGNSKVEAFSNSKVEASSNSTIRAWGSSIITKPRYSSFEKDNLILSENSVFKDCSTGITYQGGEWEWVLFLSCSHPQ